MAELSKEVGEKARETESIISQRISVVGQSAIYEALGVDKNAFGRFYGNQNGFGLREFSQALAMAGLKVVPAEATITPPDCLAVPHSIVFTAWRDAAMHHGMDSPQVKEYTNKLIRAGLFKRSGKGKISVAVEALIGE